MLDHPLGILVILAIMAEFLTETLKRNIPFADRMPGHWIAAAAGVLLCYFTDTGLLELTGGFSRSPYFDYFVTGLIISRGSGVMHDLIEALKGFTRRLSARV